MTPEEQKRALLKQLLQAQPPARPKLAPRPPGTRAPASFAQERVWFVEALAPDAGAFGVPASHWLDGRLDVAALEKAFTTLVARHEVLRTVLVSEGGQLWQSVQPAAPVVIPVDDLSALPLAQAEQRCREAAREALEARFDLARGPLMRLQLLRLSPERHALLWNFHHLVLDGVSVPVVTQELLALYTAYSAGKSDPLEPVRLQFGDWAAWQRALVQGPARARPLAYWKKQLQGAPAVCELPADFPRPPMRSAAGAAVERRLPVATSARLREVAASEKVSVFMLLHAAFSAFLAQHTGNDDVVVGTPVAGRDSALPAGAVGFFVNSVVLRSRVPAGATWRELIARSRLTVLEALQHQELPFEQLVAELNPTRELGRDALFQLEFQYISAEELQLSSDHAAESAGVRWRVLVPEVTRTNFDVSLYLYDEPQGLRMQAVFATELYRHATVERFLARFEAVLAAALSNPGARVDAAPAMLPDEAARVLGEWNSTRMPFPDGAGLHELVEEQARRTPDARALSFDGGSLSYRALDERGNQVARALLEAGLRPEGLVALLGERGPGLVVGMLGVLKAGGAYLPLDLKHPPERLAAVLRESGAGLVAVSRARRASLLKALEVLPPQARPRVLELDGLGDGLSPERPSRPQLGAQALAYVIFTSGSTGVPKGAMVEHRGAVNHLWVKVKDLGLQATDVVAQNAPTSFDISVWQTFSALAVGGTTHVVSDEVASDPDALWREVRQARVSVLEVVPSLLAELVRVQREAFGGAGPLRWLVATGEALPPALCRAWFEVLPSVPVVNAYGPTECSDDVTHHVLRSAFPGAHTPIGRPVGNMRAYVLDARLRPAPPGVPGELYLGGVGVGRGYAGKPALTAERFLPDPFGAIGERMYRSGDLVRWNEVGELVFLGRVDHQVKVRGHRIELGEIEAALLAQPHVEAAVVAVQGDRLVAWVQGQGSGAELKAALRRTLPESMIPSGVAVLAALPLNANGKVDRHALPPVELESAAALVAPRDAREEAIAAVWRELLGREAVGVDQSFFELGGHSLLATQLASKLRARFEIELPLRVMFEEPTIEGQARVVGAAARGASAAIGPRQAGPLPVSFAQERLLFLEALSPGQTTYLVPAELELDGPLDVERLRAALRFLVQRHEVLRTRLTGEPASAVQEILPEVPVALPVEEVTEAQAERALLDEVARPVPLDGAPLWRARLLRLSPTRHRLLWSFHHAITDAWSLGLLQEELSVVYDALSRGAAPALPALEVQYADFARWQREQLTGEALERQLAFWKKQLEGLGAPLELPTDRPRPTVQTSRGGFTATVFLDAEAEDALRALAAREGATEFMILAAALDALLHCYTGERDVVIGSPVAGRTAAHAERLLGLFVNTLVLRTAVEPGDSFTTLLRRVRRTALDAFDHQVVPFEKVVEAVNPPRDRSRTPLFQVCLDLHHASPPPPRDGLSIRESQRSAGTAKFDLTFSWLRDERGLSSSVNYNADLFDAETAAQLHRHLCRLLGEALRAPHAPLASLALLTDEERETQLGELARTAVPMGERPLAHEAFFAQAARTPKAIAVRDHARELSYEALAASVRALAARLTGLGVGPDTRVALLLDRSTDALVALLAVLEAGGAYVPMEPSLPAARLSFLLEDARAAVVLTHAAHRRLVEGSRAAVVCLDEPWPLAVAPAPRARRPDPENLAYVIYTSGSTGKPKGSMITHRGLRNYLWWARGEYPIEGSEGAPVHSSLSFDMPVTAVFLPLMVGGAVEMLDTASDVELLAKAMERRRFGVVKLTPSHLEILRQRFPQGLATTAPGSFIIGGEALSPELIAFWRSVAPRTALVNEYGPTETVVGCAIHTVGADEVLGATVPIGRGVANTRLLVLDPTRRLLPRGAIGELYIGGEGVARGYLDRPEVTAERFVPDPYPQRPGDRLYRTGDRVRLRRDGALEYLGRFDFQVKVRGYRIELGEIDAALLGLPGVREAAVVVKGPKGAAWLVAYVSGAVDPAAVKAGLQQRLPAYMVPSVVVVLPAMPLNANGKIERARLPEPPEDAATGDDERPRGPREELIASLCAQLLGRARFGRTASFFEAGGHSLLATQLVMRLREAFSVQLPLAAVFESPTVAGLALAVERAQGVTARPGVTALGRKETRASYAQERLWFLDQMQPGEATYNVPLSLRFVGPLDVEALRWAFERLVARHQVLRSRLVGRDGRAVLEEQVGVTVALVPEAAGPGDAERVADEEANRGFALDAAPLMRLRLLREGPERHVLVWTLHHAVVDAWSMGVLWRDLGAFYEARRAGQPAALPELPVQYGDYAEWQRAWLEGGELDRQVQYWKTKLAGVGLGLEVPTDRPRPAVQTTRGAFTERVKLPPEVTDGVRALARREGVTEYMVLAAALKAMLFRYTGQSDVVVGTPVAGRVSPAVEGLTGFFINTLVMRTAVERGLTFTALLRRVRETALQAYEHQDVPFEKLVEALNPPRDLSRTPFFQIELNLQDEATPLAWGPVSLEPFRTGSFSAQFDLSFNFERGPGGLALYLDYNADLYEAATASRLLAHLGGLLAHAVRDPVVPVGALALLSPQEEQHQRVGLTRTARAFPREQAMHQLFEAQVDARPQASAVWSNGQRLTYAELEAEANRKAHALRAQGAGPEGVVALLAPRGPALLEAMLGVWKAGAAYLPLDVKHPPARIAQVLQGSAARWVVVSREHEATLRAALASLSTPPQVLALEGLGAGQSAARPAVPHHPQRLAYVIFTSGSTGVPKGALVHHEGAVNHLLVKVHDLGLSATDVVAQTAPVCFDISVWQHFSALAVGGCTAFMSEDVVGDPEALLAAARGAGVTTLEVVPSLLQEIVRAGRLDSGPLRWMVVTGEALPPQLCRDWLARKPGVPLVNAYGPTECSDDVTHQELRAAPAGAITPIGAPVANMRPYVLDAAMRLVPLGMPGELYLGGVGVGRGYANRSDLTAERFVPDPFEGGGGRLYRTGDLVRWDGGGRLLFLGRIDHQVKVRGHRIELAEIEAVLMAQPGVTLAVATVRGEVLVAYVGGSGEEAALKAALKAVLPEYMVPSRVVVLAALPLNANGKVDRAALPAPDDAAADAQPPSTSAELLLADVWTELLGPAVAITKATNFFDAGGHSLLVTRMVSRLKKLLSVDVPLRAVFDAPTLEALALTLEQLSPELTEAMSDAEVEAELQALLKQQGGGG